MYMVWGVYICCSLQRLNIRLAGFLREVAADEGLDDDAGYL